MTLQLPTLPKPGQDRLSHRAWKDHTCPNSRSLSEKKEMMSENINEKSRQAEALKMRTPLKRRWEELECGDLGRLKLEKEAKPLISIETAAFSPLTTQRHAVTS